MRSGPDGLGQGAAVTVERLYQGLDLSPLLLGQTVGMSHAYPRVPSISRQIYGPFIE